jgi:hypothetical protein
MNSATTGRDVYWGHWALTLIQRGHGGRDVLYNVSFPVGVQGPMDGILGSPERQGWNAVCQAWRERGELPAKATRIRHGHSRWDGKLWVDCTCGAEFVQDCPHDQV